MESPSIWVALIAGAGFIVTLISFWLNFNDRILKVAKDASEKLDKLRDERESAGGNFTIQIAAIHASLAMFREQVAKDQREYVTREMLRDFEQRIERSMQATVEAINRLTNRIDSAFEDRS